MKFALLGLDPFTLALADHIAQSPDHHVVAAYELDVAQQRLLEQSLGAATARDAWEELLHESVADVVVVAGLIAGDEAQREARAEQLRKLAQSGLALLLVLPACESIVGYELEMIRRDTGTRILPIVPGVPHRLWMLLRRHIAEGEAGELGKAEQLVLQRSLPTRDAGPLRVALSRDAALVQSLVGQVRKVGALGQAFVAGGPFHLSATLDTAAQILVQWSVQASTEAEETRLSLLGTRDQTLAARERASGNWAVTGPAGRREVLAADETPRELLAHAERWLQGEPEWLSWLDASRAQEVAESIERSAARGKTIELFNEEPSEEGTFKGMMAIGSCGLLLLTLLVLVLGAMIEGLRLPFARMQHRQARQQAEFEAGGDPQPAASPDAPPAEVERSLLIRLWPVYPFLLFLLLQLMNVLFIRPSRRPTSSPGDSAADNEDAPD